MKNSINYFFKKQIFKKLKKIAMGKIIWHDQTQHEFGDPNSSKNNLTVNIYVKDQKFYKKLALGGSVAAAESYMLHEWECDDLTKLFMIVLHNDEAHKHVESGLAFFINSLRTIANIFTINHLKRARNNILRHYDLSNDFFQLFLDKNMQYSSAIFDNTEQTLDQAQENKLKIICEKLQLTPEDQLLEIGTGWGGLAIYAAQNYNCHVTTTTISEEQYEHTSELITALNLQDKVTLLKQDYRKLSGKFDKVVSIEMIESIGFHYFSKFFQVCDQLLKSGGVFLLQSITITDQEYDRYKREQDFIKKYIFPNGCLPSVHKITDCLKKKTSMRIIELNDYGDSYAHTLMLWRERFHQHLAEIYRLGFDDNFINMFHFYFCYCEAGFRSEYISVTHILLKKQ